MVDELEQEYLQVINKYSSDEIQKLCELLSMLIELLEPEPADILGQLYMELGLTSEENGQYFSPSSITDLMANLNYSDEFEKAEKPFFTLHEPACGAGGMILSFAKLLIQKKQNPAHKLWVSAIDVNRVAAQMCYIQMFLWNIPGEVIVGNSLSMKLQERWYTGAHHLYQWREKLRLRDMFGVMQKICEGLPEREEAKVKPEPLEKPQQKSFSSDQVQFDFCL